VSDNAIGTGEWLQVTQDMVNKFADLTGDHQWIHVDVHRAESGPYRTTIAHGFLTLALLSQLSRADRPHPPGTTMAVNYGLNRVRFPAPVPVGSRIRARTRNVGEDRIAEDVVQVTYEISIEVAGGTKPACVAEMVCRYQRQGDS